MKYGHCSSMQSGIETPLPFIYWAKPRLLINVSSAIQQALMLKMALGQLYACDKIYPGHFQLCYNVLASYSIKTAGFKLLPYLMHIKYQPAIQSNVMTFGYPIPTSTILLSHMRTTQLGQFCHGGLLISIFLLL